MRNSIALVFFICISLATTAQKDFKPLSFTGFTMRIPAAMDTMPADKILVKYNKKPDSRSAYYANADFSFSAVIDEVAQDITGDMLLPLKPLLLTQLGNQKFTEDKILTINNHKVIAVSFNSEVPGNKIFNRRIFFVANKKLFSVAYNTTEADLKNRKAQIESSIRSLLIK